MLQSSLVKKCEFVWDMLHHLPYSHGLASTDYHLFRVLKKSFGGEIFNGLDNGKIGIHELFNSKS